jgi:hypothetical protein
MGQLHHGRTLAGEKGRNIGEWKGGRSIGSGVNEGEVGREGVLGDVGGRWE